MKFSDINENLTEAPGGFADRAKAKLQKKIAPGKERRKRGAMKEKLFAKAKEIKNELKQWHDDKTGTPKLAITMQEFLSWMQDNYPQFGDTAEKFARGDKAYAEFFAQAVDDEGNQTSTASDDKVKVNDPDSIPPGKVSNSPPEKISDKEKQAGYDKINKDAEDEAAEFDKQDLKASKGEDKEPKVDTSASIYEARLQAMLSEDEEDVGVNRAKTLADDQIDTIIVGGIRGFLSAPGKEKQAALGQATQEPKAKDEIGKTADKISKASRDDSEDYSASSRGEGSVLDEYADELEDILTAVANGKDISNNQKGYARAILDEL